MAAIVASMGRWWLPVAAVGGFHGGGGGFHGGGGGFTEAVVASRRRRIPRWRRVDSMAVAAQEEDTGKTIY